MAGKPVFGKPGKQGIDQDGEGRAVEDRAQEGLPGEVFRGLGIEFKAAELEADTFTTRVKMPKPGEEAKTSKDDITSTRPTPPKLTGSASEKRIQKIQADLQEQMDVLATLTMFKLPVTGVYMGRNSERALTALMDIARKRPKMLDAMEKASDAFDGYEIAKFAVGLGIAFQVDVGRMQADNPFAVMTGVTQVIAESFSDNGEGDINSNVTSVKEPAHAQRFEPQ